jgi:hypothetical protein
MFQFAFIFHTIKVTFYLKYVHLHYEKIFKIFTEIGWLEDR